MKTSEKVTCARESMEGIVLGIVGFLQADLLD